MVSKKMLVSTISFLLIGNTTWASKLLDQPQLVGIQPELTFMPPGFDDNDRSQVVIAGAYRSSCYKTGPSTARVDLESKTITITHQAYFYRGMCLQMLVPYLETVDVGLLPAGEYQVKTLDAQGQTHSEGTLPVAQSASTTPDDFLYAPIDQTYVTPAAGGATLTLSGTYPTDCMSLKETKVFYRSKNIIEVLPIVEATDGPNCHDTNVSFETQVNLMPPWSGKTLIYIRSLNGKSLSSLFEF